MFVYVHPWLIRLARERLQRPTRMRRNEPGSVGGFAAPGQRVMGPRDKWGDGDVGWACGPARRDDQTIRMVSL